MSMAATLVEKKQQLRDGRNMPGNGKPKSADRTQ